MAGTIKVTPELLMGKASELRGMKSTHDETMERMRSLMLGLNEIWTGDAQKALLDKYEGMQGTFREFAEILEAYAKLMETSAKTLQGADQELYSTINASFG